MIMSCTFATLVRAACLGGAAGIVACRTTPGTGEQPAPDIPSPVYRTPTITLPPATVTKPPTVRERLEQLADSVAQSTRWRGARLGMLVVDAESGDTLLSRDADKLFVPASNQKLLTAAVALQVLGAEHRWRTPILLRGGQAGSTWQGDLLIVGRGDPSWSDSLRTGGALSSFDDVHRALVARGIHHITGSIYTVGDAFPGVTTGAGWEVDDLDGPYAAPVDELLLNEGMLEVRVRGGARAGAPVQVSLHPTRNYPPVDIQARTGSGERLRVQYDSTASSLVVTGTLGVNESTRALVAYRHPNDAVRIALYEALGARGVGIGRAPCCAARAQVQLPHADASDTLVVLESPPMQDVLARMQKPSQNQVAEMLFRTSGLVGTGFGDADSSRALAIRTLNALGIDTADVAYRDGSGMSRHNFVTPRAIVTVLSAMQHSPHFNMWYTALPIAGKEGTLLRRMRGTPLEGNVRAKTGSLNRVRSLSGYVTSADGRMLTFSLLANNYVGPSRDVDEVHEMLLEFLASVPVAVERTR